jgi:hypothetical protein
MPLVTVEVPSGLGSDRLRAIGDAIHDALVQALAIPDDDDFIAIHEHTAETLRIHPSFFGIERSAEATDHAPRTARRDEEGSVPRTGRSPP